MQRLMKSPTMMMAETVYSTLEMIIEEACGSHLDRWGMKRLVGFTQSVQNAPRRPGAQVSEDKLLYKTELMFPPRHVSLCGHACGNVAMLGRQ